VFFFFFFGIKIIKFNKFNYGQTIIFFLLFGDMQESTTTF